MPDHAHSAGFRALLAGAALSAALIAGFATSSASATAAQVSIVNGKKASIKDSPWQVAIAFTERASRPASPLARFFCGGSLITPELVVTAGHCVADLKPGEIKRVEIISGRSWLNNTGEGDVTKAGKVLMPLRPNGKRRYNNNGGGASWDVALIELASPVTGPTIKLAGADEAALWSPGQVVSTTGWGITSGFANRASAVLRSAKQVMLPDKLCRQYDGSQYDVKTMNCIGGPAGNTSTCSGDSGGPLVATVGTEIRLVGLTSFGDSYCSTLLPSIDSRVAGDAMRSWVQETALRVSGVDVVGTGAIAPPPRTWCVVPSLAGLKLGLATRKLEAAGCSLGKVKTYPRGSGSRGKVVTGSFFFSGWLAPLKTPIGIYLDPK